MGVKTKVNIVLNTHKRKDLIEHKLLPLGALCNTDDSDLLLPGGATILCHFWNRQVFRQSLGLRL